RSGVGAFRTSRRRVIAATTPARADGSHDSIPASGRVRARTPTPAPITANAITPDRSQRAWQSPATAAAMSSTMPMPISSAALSEVPNQAIAVSFAQAGAASISAPPTTANGLEEGASNAPADSPTPAPSTAAATPADAAAHGVAATALPGRAETFMMSGYEHPQPSHPPAGDSRPTHRSRST